MKNLTTALLSLALVFSTTFAAADNHATPTKPVGMVYGLDVSDPQAFAAALTKYWGSPTGEKNPGIAILRQVVAGGESPISHVVSVVYPSYEAMDVAFAINAQSEDAATFQSEVSGAVEVVTSSMFESTGLGSIKNQIGFGPGTASLYVFAAVSNPAKYASAFQEMMGSTDIGETDTMLFAIPAGGVGDTTHVVSVTGKSVGTVMAQMNTNRADKAFQKFIKEVGDIRTIEQNIVTVDMAVFGNMGG